MSKTPTFVKETKEIKAQKIPNLVERPVSALLNRFKDNPANRGLLLKDRYEAPKNDADRSVLC